MCSPAACSAAWRCWPPSFSRGFRHCAFIILPPNHFWAASATRPGDRSKISALPRCGQIAWFYHRGTRRSCLAVVEMFRVSGSVDGRRREVDVAMPLMLGIGWLILATAHLRVAFRFSLQFLLHDHRIRRILKLVRRPDGLQFSLMLRGKRGAGYIYFISPRCRRIRALRLCCRAARGYYFRFRILGDRRHTSRCLRRFSDAAGQDGASHFDALVPKAKFKHSPSPLPAAFLATSFDYFIARLLSYFAFGDDAIDIFTPRGDAMYALSPVPIAHASLMSRNMAAFRVCRECAGVDDGQH